MKSVIFVCMGKICRSPTGEGVLQKFVVDRDLQSRIRIDSAGTIDYHTGHAADTRMQAAANKRGYRLESRARQVTKADCTEFDLIIAMDRDNLHYLQKLSPDHIGKMKLLGEFLKRGEAGQGTLRDVPDPYYGGVDGFEEVLDMIEVACPSIIDELLGNDS